MSEYDELLDDEIPRLPGVSSQEAADAIKAIADARPNAYDVLENLRYASGREVFPDPRPQPAKRKAKGAPAGPSETECERWRYHRAGAYCKTCGKTW